MENIKNILIAVSLIIILSIGIYFALNISNKNAIELIRISECVEAEAYHQNYAGNPYSEEAHILFAKNCSN